MAEGLSNQYILYQEPRTIHFLVAWLQLSIRPLVNTFLNLKRYHQFNTMTTPLRYKTPRLQKYRFLLTLGISYFRCGAAHFWWLRLNGGQKSKKNKTFFFIISPSQILLRFNKVYSKLLTSEKFDVMTEILISWLKAWEPVSSLQGAARANHKKWRTSGTLVSCLPTCRTLGSVAVWQVHKRKKARRTLFLTILHAFSLLKAREQLPVLRLS